MMSSSSSPSQNKLLPPKSKGPSTIYYDSIATNSSETTTKATTASSVRDDDNGSRGFQKMKGYSDNDSLSTNTNTYQQQEFLLPTLRSQASAYDDNDGTFLKKDWLDIPSSSLTSSSSFWKYFCCCCNNNFRMERNAIHFGIRMAVLLTVSSMFVFLNFQEGMWVLITVLFVCWFPRLDSASVVEKSIQRLIGTVFGATLALSCGFASLWLFDVEALETTNKGENEQEATPGDSGQTSRQHAYQAAFLAACIFVVTFAVGFAILQFRIQGTPIIQKYNYASILCLLTFTIGLFPFYDGGDDYKNARWLRALYRVQNVIIGCILGSVGSMVVLPKSTTLILLEQIHRQIRLAGEASEAVLHAAADSFSGALQCLNLADELLETPTEKSRRLAKQGSRVSFRAVKRSVIFVRGDRVLETYEAALKDWRVTKGVFSILQYDPFNVGIPQETQDKFKTETANALARALRIQTTVVLMDGIIRNDPKHSFSDEDLEIFADSGTLVSQMLMIPLNPTASEEAACILTEKLHQVRQMIVDNSARVANNSRESLPRVNSREHFELLMAVNNDGDVDGDHTHDSHGRGVPTFVKGSNVCALLFLQLVEHLILRSLRLYNSWKQVEAIHNEILKAHNNKKLL